MANTIELKQQIQQGAYDAAFVKLYGVDVDVNAQRERYISVIIMVFSNSIGILSSPEIAIPFSIGRCQEHRMFGRVK